MCQNKKSYKDYINTDRWFAWFPVKTDEGWVWWNYVERTIDDCPVQYLGLETITTYKKIK